MKIRSVKANRHRKAVEVTTAQKRLLFPFSRLRPMPTPEDPIARMFVDKDLGSEGFTYVLASGQEGTAHIEQVLEYNRDPDYLRDALLYKLTIEVQRRVSASSLSRREIIRRLGTSAAQFYRLLDQTNYSKSVDQLVSLLQVLDCEVDLVVRRARSA
ncbi:MAG: hypothetical protein WEG40_21065 [Candidatus Rokuibacteriota bacterium]